MTCDGTFNCFKMTLFTSKCTSNINIIIMFTLLEGGLVGSIGKASDFGSEGLEFDSRRLSVLQVLSSVGKDIQPPFPPST